MSAATGAPTGLTALTGLEGHTGLVGGTFNPIHQGHLRAAEEVASALGLARMVFIPSARPPHKDDDPEDPIAPPQRRLAWVRDAVRANPRFAVDTIEVERAGPSFLVDTLRHYRDALGGELPVFVVGVDAFREMGSWREPEALFALAHFAVTLRPPAGWQLGQPGHTLGEWLPACVRDAFELSADGHAARHREAPSTLRLVPITALEISATAIRKALREGRSIRYLVPERVRAAIEASGIYGDPR